MPRKSARRTYMNSCQKGKRGERACRDILREHGFRARRGRQYCGSPDSPDVICDDLPEVHFEVKWCEASKVMYNWMAQAKADAFGETDLTSKIPVVVHKQNHCEELAILPFRTLLEIFRRSDLIERKT